MLYSKRTLKGKNKGKRGGRKEIRSEGRKKGEKLSPRIITHAKRGHILLHVNYVSINET